MYGSPDQACDHCASKGLACSEKYSKQQFIQRDTNANNEVYGMQASAFIDFWIKMVRISTPDAKDEDILSAFKQSIEVKERQLRLKRGLDPLGENGSEGTGREMSVDTAIGGSPKAAFTNHHSSGVFSPSPGRPCPALVRANRQYEANTPEKSVHNHSAARMDSVPSTQSTYSVDIMGSSVDDSLFESGESIISYLLNE